MERQNQIVIRRRLALPEEDEQEDPPPSPTPLGAPGPQVDGISSLVALALDNHLPLLADGFIDNPSAITVRAGGGGFATVNVSRLAVDLTGQKYSFYDEAHLQFRSNRAAGKKLAVKIAAMADEDDDSKVPMESLAKEIRILSHETLRSHANIVDVVALGWSGTIHDDPMIGSRFPVLLMEYADCGTLDDFFRLEGITFDWRLKVSIAYDIAQGLEALDDACVIHGDLKLANILLFRTGTDTFTAKLCDLGSAMTPVDLPEGAVLRQTVFTPPWNAPESLKDLDVDDAYKIDIYSYGLLLCRIFLHGSDPFQMKYQTIQSTTPESLRTAIQEWKDNDCVVDICSFAIRNLDVDRYTNQQLETLNSLFGMTVRTDVASRVDEYVTIKALLRPELADEDSEQRGNFSWEAISHETLPRLFSNGLVESVPKRKMDKCWASMLPPNIAFAIVEDLRNIASIDVSDSASDGIRERASAAAYELSMCHIQGFGCKMSYDQAGQFLIKSAAMGNRRAQNDISRVLGALGVDMPPLVKDSLLQWTVANAISGSPSAMEDLYQIDSSALAKVKRSLRTNLSPFGVDIFGDDFRTEFDLQDPSAFMDQIGHTNGMVDIGDDFEEGITWLHYAAANGASRVAGMLLESPGCNVDCSTVDGYTPLWIACAAGHYHVAEVLIQKGADVKAVSKTGQTCLHHLQAFEPDLIEKIAPMLIVAGADLVAKDFNGETPLASAVLKKQGPEAIPAVRWLIHNGADPTAVTSRGYSCVDLAVMNLDPPLLATLLSSAVFGGENAVASSASTRAKALKKLFKTTKYHRFRHGSSLRRSKTKEVLELLLIPDDIFVAYAKDSSDSRSPLHDACIWGCTDLIEPLLSYDAMNIDCFSEETEESGASRLPLFEALKLSHKELVQTLINQGGADVTLQDSACRNILHFTVEYAPDLFNWILSCLVKRGCDVQQFVNAGTRQQGFTPLDMAVRAERFDIADALIGFGAQYRDFSRTGEAGERYNTLGICGGSRAQMSYFLDKPSDDRSHDLVVCSNGFTLFHLTAASFDNALLERDLSPADNIDFLLRYYASPADANRIDHQGNTPLHIAAFSGNTSVAETLLELTETDPNARNEFGRTALDLLEHRKRSVGQDMKELQLVDDLEKRNWKDRNQRMETLLKNNGAVASAHLEAISDSRM